MPGEDMSPQIPVNSNPPAAAPHPQDASPNLQNQLQPIEIKPFRNSHQKQSFLSRCVTLARTPVFIGEFHSSARRTPPTMSPLRSRPLRNPQKKKPFRVHRINRATFSKMRLPPC